MGSEEFPLFCGVVFSFFFRFSSFFVASSFYFSFFFAVVSHSKRTRAIAKGLQFTAKMGNFTPTLSRSAPKGRQQMGETSFLRKSAVSCENLRFPAVFCANLRLPKCLDLQSEPKSAKICENVRSGSGFSLLLSPFCASLLSAPTARKTSRLLPDGAVFVCRELRVPCPRGCSSHQTKPHASHIARPRCVRLGSEGKNTAQLKGLRTLPRATRVSRALRARNPKKV